MAIEKKETTVIIEPSGTIFTETVTVFVDDTAKEVARSVPHRAPYEPVQPNGTSSKLPDDPVLHKIAAIVWTPDVIAAAKKRIAAALKLDEITGPNPARTL